HEGPASSMYGLRLQANHGVPHAITPGVVANWTPDGFVSVPTKTSHACEVAECSAVAYHDAVVPEPPPPSAVMLSVPPALGVTSSSQPPAFPAVTPVQLAYE